MRVAAILVAGILACAPAQVTSSPTASASRAPSTTAPSPTIQPTPSSTATPASTATSTPLVTPSASPGVMPLFDAHLHYSREAWTAYPVERVRALLDQVSVRIVLVSSAPDEGTFRLREGLGGRVIATLGPYRNMRDVSTWTRDGTILPYLESAYRAGFHKGFGEFHLGPGQVGLPVVQQVLAFARARGLFLHAHADARAVGELLEAVGANYHVLWAHAGVTATPEQIDALLARWPKLWVELSLRDDVAPGGTLDPRWRALFLKYPERFMVGTDTWTVGDAFTGNERWATYVAIVNGIRAWLRQLPADVAERIAHRNGEHFVQLFG